jgi:hypothetical protein
MICDLFARSRLVRAGLIALGLSLAGCAGSTVTVIQGGTPTTAATATPTPSPTPTPACVQLVAGATPASGVTNMPGIQLPSGTYISAATTGGGGSGQYSDAIYTLCFHGSESAIDGGPFNPPSSTIGHLVHDSGWIANNLFPDPSNFSYLDYCSAPQLCVNTSGSPNPFTFAGFSQYASHSGGYTTFTLKVATIAAPTCLNDAQYYSGTPKYTLYEDGSSASSSNPTYHFQMPPATRVSTYKGGGTAGSTYAYFCSAGTQATVVSSLKQSMQNDGYAISGASASGFSASVGSGPTYQVDVSVSNPNNYYLRIFVPM